jgi:hypothetical protein
MKMSCATACDCAAKHGVHQGCDDLPGIAVILALIDGGIEVALYYATVRTQSVAAAKSIEMCSALSARRLFETSEYCRRR